MKKRILSILLALCLIPVCAVGIASQAASTAAPKSSNNYPNTTIQSTVSGTDVQNAEDAAIWAQAFSKIAPQATSTQRIDLVFVIDATGSMAGEISSVKTNITEFMRLFADTGIQLRVGFIEYQDITCDGNASTIIHKNGTSVWHTTSAQAVTTLSKITAKGGGDDPETPIDALGNLVERWDETSDFDWATDASRFAVLITDASYKTNNNHGYADMDALINACILSARKLTVSVITDPYYYATYKDLVEKTGGIMGDIGSSFAALLTTLATDIMSKVDTDGDGLLDEWETSGDVNDDGITDITGADPNKSDIYVKIDWMPGFKPSNAALETVCTSFANSGAGHQNKGINLHLVWGREIPHTKVIDLTSNYDPWLNLANTYFNNDIERRVYRWALFADQYDVGDGVGSSGLACGIPNQLFMVTLGGWEDASNATVVGGTFMHELGHTLGLCHGGQDHTNNKPNYLSIMNYLFQTDGLVGTGALDYSRYALPTLNESSLSESNGIDPESLTAGTGLGTKLYKETGIDIWGWRPFSWSAGEKTEVSIAGKAIDYNTNGNTTDTGLKINLNNDTDDSGNEVFGELKSYNDWDNIVFVGGTIGMRGVTLPNIEINPPKEILHELTYEEAVELGSLTSVTLSDSVTIYRNEDKDYFKKLDTSNVYWKAGNEKLFKIDRETGELTFKLGASSLIYGSVKVTATDADGNVLAETIVKVTWTWWKWILVVFFLGWLYL